MRAPPEDAGLRRILVRGIGGEYEVVFSPRGVAFVSFPQRPIRGTVAAAPPEDESDPFVRELRQAFTSWAEGGDAPRRLAVDIRRATPFQREVWAVLRSVPRGSVLTYGAVAERAGRPQAARAAGQACAANPAPVVIPCHRVIAAGGLGGFGPGSGWKRALLSAEGAGV